MSSALTRQAHGAVALLAVAGVLLAGCSSPDPVSNSGPTGTADGVVKIYGAISGNEAQLLEESWAAWESANGIDIQYEASRDFESQVGIRAQTGNAPDLALFPQPGYLSDLASLGFVKPLPATVAANVAANWDGEWAEHATVDGVLYGAPLTTTVKGFIWYSPSQFEELGLVPPRNWDELMVLTDSIHNRDGSIGRAPWCAGFASDATSGSAGTDWIESIVLRQAGAEVYDQWVAGEIAFTDPIIEQAFETAGSILLNPYMVNAGFGRVDSINTTSFEDVALAIAKGRCALHHQASFFESYLKDPAKANLTVAKDGDVWAFLTPPMAGKENAVTVGGEFVAAFSDDSDTVKVQEYLSSPEWADSRMALGGVISANRAASDSSVESAILQEARAILLNSGLTIRFDASDSMPAVVGTGSFLEGMTDWINGKPTRDVLASIEASRPNR